VKIGVWCAVSWQRIIGPILFSETANSERYINIIHEFLGHLKEDEIDQGWFQQDGAMSHTSRYSLNERTLGTPVTVRSVQVIMATSISGSYDAIFLFVGILEEYGVGYKCTQSW